LNYITNNIFDFLERRQAYLEVYTVIYCFITFKPLDSQTFWQATA